MAYYYITVKYLNSRRTKHGYYARISGHIIKANSESGALRIRKQHRIAYPIGSLDISRITIRRLDMRLKHNKDWIARRKKGIGGSVWYEDKKGRLRIEK